MIHELRIYQCIPGKLPALLKRFESKTLDIWKKHGIRPTGFWTVLIGEGNNCIICWPGSRSPSASRSGTRSRPIPTGTRRATRAKRTAC